MRGETHRTGSVSLRRVISLLIGAALVAGLIAAPSGAANRAGSSPSASPAKKKCKKKNKKASAAKKKKCKKKKQTTQPAPANVTITPTSLDYGGVATGSATNPSNFTVSNTGGSNSGQPVPALSGANTSQFQIIGTSCNTQLLPGISCTVSVAFAPTSVGAKSASLDVVASPGGTVHAGLSGAGVGPAQVTITPTTGHAYGNSYTGFDSGSIDFKIDNTGGVDSGPPIISFSGTDPGQFLISSTTCSGSLPPAGNCHVFVVFHPTSNGAKSASLNVSATPGGSASSTPLTGTGITDIAIAPTSHDYGLNLAGSMVSQTFTVTNNGSSPTGALTAAFLGGVNTNDYAIANNTCTGTMVAASGGTCTFDVVFKPATLGSPQLRSSAGTVTIRGNPGGQVTATLAGTVLEL